MNGGSGLFPFGGTSVNIFSNDNASPDYNTYWQEYAKRLGYAPQNSAPDAAQTAALQEQQKVQQMLYDYLLKVWGIPQDVFDCGFEEYKLQMQQQEERKMEDTRAFVRKKLSGEPIGTPAEVTEGAPGVTMPELVPKNTEIVTNTK